MWRFTSFFSPSTTQAIVASGQLRAGLLLGAAVALWVWAGHSAEPRTPITRIDPPDLSGREPVLTNLVSTNRSITLPRPRDIPVPQPVARADVRKPEARNAESLRAETPQLRAERALARETMLDPRNHNLEFLRQQKPDFLERRREAIRSIQKVPRQLAPPGEAP